MAVTEDAQKDPGSASMTQTDNIHHEPTGDNQDQPDDKATDKESTKSNKAAEAKAAKDKAAKDKAA